MSDGPLLVPAHLYAMVLTDQEIKGAGFFSYAPDYTALAKYEAVDPEPFATASAKPQAGVWLHWMIPRPLRHATDAAEGASTFRLVPNRWLVVRVGGGAPLAAWVVISDQLGGGQGSPYVNPGSGTDGPPSSTTIGSCMTLAEYLAAPPKTGDPFLQAVRPGDATFTAFAPAAQNVFAFHDPMGEGDLAAGTFAYHVVGWYSQGDPIAGVEWDNRRLPTDPGSTRPSGSRPGRTRRPRPHRCWCTPCCPR